MGIVYWFVIIFTFSLFVKLGLYIFQSKVDRLSKSSELLKYIRLEKNLSGSFYNFLAVNQIISTTSVTLYLWYEYVEKQCFKVDCLLSDVVISGTRMVKLEIIVSTILIIG